MKNEELKKVADELIRTVKSYVNNRVVPLHACYQRLEGQYAQLDAKRAVLEAEVQKLKEMQDRSDKALLELVRELRQLSRLATSDQP